MNKTGRPIVLSAPSGGGKSTIAAALLNKLPNVRKSISCTTRFPRPGEKNGEDYIFVSDHEFIEMASRGEFLEWALVHENKYGTPKTSLQSMIDRGHDVLLVIDPQGAVSVKKIFPSGIFIFVVPPSWDVLVQRLKSRGADSKSSLETRLQNVRKEVGYLDYYDYVVVNEDLEKAMSDVINILLGKTPRMGPSELYSNAFIRETVDFEKGNLP